MGEIRKIRLNTAEPPPEILEVIRQQKLQERYIHGWLAVPAINPPCDHIRQKEMQEGGKVDALKQLEPFLGNQILDQTLRTLDVLNGCGNHCDTCLADAALPSRMFSFDSLSRLFADGRFLAMLQPDSIRIGSAGDLTDHPQGAKIAEMVLEATARINEEYRNIMNGTHKVKVFVNYRTHHEERLDQLIDLAKKYTERLRLTISLPFNKTDVVNSKFMDFIKQRNDLFGNRNVTGKDGLLKVAEQTNITNVGIQDVRHPRLLFKLGRIVSEKVNAGRIAEYDMVDGDREKSFAERGLVKTFLNPDALWLMIYATPYESHTTRVFTPLTNDNLEAFSHTSWHFDFPKPPNWPGHTDQRDWREAQALKKQQEASGKQMKPYTIVK